MVFVNKKLGFLIEISYEIPCIIIFQLEHPVGNWIVILKAETVFTINLISIVPQKFSEQT